MDTTVSHAASFPAPSFSSTDDVNVYLSAPDLLKRGLDITGALVALLFAAPLIALCGVLIYRESPGSIIDKQRRLGRNGELFTICKLRTMKLDPENHGPGWTAEDAPRSLKVGKLIRAWNIDGVPQFWNVLKGEMSLVGPRPERPEIGESLHQEFPGWDKRLAVKPGLTGWAQVRGRRGDPDLTEGLHYDLDYIRRGNLFMDLAIMLHTFISKENAC